MAKKKSYNKMYDENQQQIVPDEAEAIVEETEAEVNDDTIVVKAPRFVTGIIVDCLKLNVRTNPSLNASVVCELPRSSEVQVDVNADYVDWYYVRAAAGIDGYCMKQFIKVDL